MGSDRILTASQFARLWFVTGLAMTLHTVGLFAGWWNHVSLTYWVGLVLLLTMTALTTIDYYQQRWA